MSICSQEVSCISEQSNLRVGYGTITETVEDRPASPIPFKREPLDPKLIRTVKETAIKHVTEKLDTKPKRIHSEHPRKTPDPFSEFQRPHEIKSLLVDASKVRPLSPVQVVVFPPELPPVLVIRSRSTTPSKKSGVESPVKVANNLKPEKKRSRSKSPRGKKIKEGNISAKLETTVNVKKQVDKIENKHGSQKKMTVEKKTTSIRDLPKPIIQSGAMASALATAPEKPFRPKVVTERALVPTGKVGLPPDVEPYFPPEHGSKDEKVSQAMREAGCKSPMTDMLTIAPQRSYSPLPSATQPGPLSSTSTTITTSVANVGFHPLRKPVSMLSALTVAPTVPFTVPGKTPVPSESLPVPSAFKPVTPTSPTFVPVPGRPHSPMKYYPAFTKIPQPSPAPVIARGEFIDKDHIEYGSTFKPSSPKPKTITTVKESTKTTDKSDTSKTKQATKSTESETFLLPYYQQNIGEIPIRRSISPIRQIRAPSYSPWEQMLHPPPSVKQMSQTKTNTVKVQQHTTEDTKDTFGLHPPNLLPYYQQNIGEIPVRNKSVSPVPHPIRAPSCEPKVIPSPKNYCFSTNSSVPVYSYRPPTPSHTFKSIQTQTEVPQVKQIKEIIKESLSEETKRSSKEEKEVHKSVTKITQDLLRPASPSTWQAKVEKTIQNLSPITVRIPSPIPKPLGHTRESTGSNIHITHHRDHTSTVSVTPIPDENNNMENYEGKLRTKTGTPTSFKGSTQSKATSRSGTASSKHVTYNIDQNVSTPGKQITQSSIQSKPLSGKTATQVSVQQTSTTLGQKVFQEEKSSNVVVEKMHDERHASKMSTQLCGGQHHATVLNATKVSTHCEKDSKGHPPATLSSKSYTTEKYTHTPGMSVKSVSGEQTSSTYLGNNSHMSSAYNKTSSHVESLGPSLTQKSYATETHVTGGAKTVKKTVVTNSCKQDGSGRSLSQSLLPLGGSSLGGNGTGGGAGGKGSVAGSTAPRRGRGVLNPNTGPQARIPLCGQCNRQIRGPFITALGKIWCPDHFVCVNAQCHRPLQDIGFVEEQEGLYCEYCFEKFLAPNCSKCNNKIKGDCLNAIGKQFHPECFSCTYCNKQFGNNPFFLEDSLPYCETDWNELFTTKCFACGFPIEAGDRWVEALNNNYHSQCFNCTMCKKNLEGQSFYAKGGRPFCKNHAR